MTYIVTALQSEAQPIIEFLNLSKKEDKNFPIFTNQNTTLIVSGIGKINSAIAVTYMNPLNKIINIGICGSPSHKIGDIYSIKKIIDKSSQKVIHLNQNGETLTCVDMPQNNPNKFKNTLVDMESFGFLQAARKFVNKENILLYKIVSDKISDTILTPKEVHDLIYPHLKSLF
jgi:nucleoside phosphorylase